MCDRALLKAFSNPYFPIIMKKVFLVILSTVLLFSCGNNSSQQTIASADELFQQQDSVLAHADECSDTIDFKYAKGISVTYLQDDSIAITIQNPDPNAKHSKQETFYVSRKTTKNNRFICTTALQLGNFEVLSLEDRIVGMNSLRNLFSPRMKEQMASGKTIKIGKEGNFDLETVIASKPDFILVSASKHGGFEALKDCGIPLISHHGYKESTPLGQAEWIKLVGLLTGEERRANAVFSDIENKYNKLKDEVAQSNVHSGKSLPTIASGRQLRDGWYIVGGQSYMAQLFKDAGANYVYSDNEDTGGVTLDFEAAYAKSINADFWQIDGAFDGNFTLSDLENEDPRYAQLKAFKDGKVMFCNLSQTPYRELAGVQPHYLLADFVKALHGELLPNYSPVYYKIISNK